MDGLDDVSVVARAVDVLVHAAPLGMVDGVDPVLDLHDDAAVLGDGARELRVVLETLRPLERRLAVLEVAGVELEGVGIGVEVDLDAGPRRVERGDRAGDAPVVGLELIAVREVAVVLRGGNTNGLARHLTHQGLV